ncbi:MAG: hypothetical protein ACO2O4_02405 [Minisyncoccia bacterium]|jgi:hypothetical protein
MLSKNEVETMEDVKKILGKRGIKKLKSFLDDFIGITRKEIKYNLKSGGTVIIEDPTIRANLEIGDVSVNIYYSFLEGSGIVRVEYKGNEIYIDTLLDLEDIYSMLEIKK